MKLTLLGTGTSQGVPVIGCECEVCQSPDPRDRRLRQSALISFGEHRILIDPGPDFRQQMLRAGVKKLDAILVTHEHNDHIIGLDDVRPFNFSSGKPMPIYAQKRVLTEIRERFSYVFGKKVAGLPELELLEIDENRAIELPGLPPILPIRIWHGRLPILGFRIGDLAYLTDCKTIDPAELEKLRGLRTLVVNALHHLPHPTHMNREEALHFIEKVQPRSAWIIHLSHLWGRHEVANSRLPGGVQLAFDGLELEISPRFPQN